MSILALALTYFLVANPIGNSPAILALVKDFPFERQKKIIFREAVFSFIIAIFFQYFGEVFLSALKISDYALTLTGGTVLFIVALGMIFPKAANGMQSPIKQEPFIVPIATPLISGAGLMTMIMITSRAELDNIKISLAIIIAWTGVIAVMVGAPYVQKIIGKRGLDALERIMGMILGLISTQMLVDGMQKFIKTLS